MGARCKMKSRNKEAELDSPDVIDASPTVLIGNGSFGQVWRGVWNSGTVVAMKAELESSEFSKESRILNMCNHPNIVRMYGVSKFKGKEWIVMEMCESSLESFLQGNLQYYADQLLEFAMDVIRGMLYLSSKNVVHRDLASRNLLLSLAEGRFRIKIADFGLAAILPRSRRSVTVFSKIDPLITAPEAMKSRRYSIKSDVWSFGVLLYTMFNRAKRVEREEMLAHINGESEMRINCPDSIRDLMRRCISTAPHHRPSLPKIYEILEKAQSPKWGSGSGVESQSMFELPSFENLKEEDQSTLPENQFYFWL